MAARFRHQGTLASKGINEQILKAQESEAILRALREGAVRSTETDDNTPPDPINREDLLEWVFWNKTVKRMQASEDAEIAAESQPKTACE